MRWDPEMTTSEARGSECSGGTGASGNEMGRIESGGIDSAFQSVTIDAEDRRNRAAELINLFARVSNTTMISADGDDPALERAQVELSESLKLFLEEAGNLALEIGPFVFLWEGHLVYEDRDPEGLPNILHQGGIGRIQFYPGIGDWELRRFFNILRTSRGRRKEPQDLIGCLQDDEELRHVDCLSVDDYLETHPLPIPENLEDLRQRYSRGSVPPLRQSIILREYCPGSENDFLKPLSKDHSFRTNILRIFNRLYFLAPEEMERINGQILRESAPGLGPYGLETLFEVLLTEKTEKDFDQIVSLILTALGHSIEAGDYGRATEVLKRLYACLRMGSLNESQRKRIKKAIFEAGTQPRVTAIAKGIESSDGRQLDELARYLSLLQRNAVPHLCRLLGELKGSKPRRIICDTLASLGRNSSEVFAAFLDDNRWYVVRNIVYILGRIGKTECLPYLEKALDHPDPRVRREAVRAISTVADRDKVLQHLVRKLNDMDSKIRGIAALHLARIGRGEAVKPLLDLVLSKAFQRREIQEIKLFLQAVGITGSDEAVPALFHILVKKSFVGKTKTDEIRKSAADALGVIGTDEAVIALSKTSKIGDELAKDAGLAVLERIGK